MKRCRRCENENEDDARFCPECGHGEFAAVEAQTGPVEIGSPKSTPKLEYLTAERVESLVILKCRTPSEAFLVAGELEAADILAILPDDEMLLKEFQENGFVSIQVSARSYEAATELQTVIERKHWEKRAQERLSIPMVLTAFGFGVIPIFGILPFFATQKLYQTKGYHRKAMLLARWFVIGFVLFPCLFFCYLMFS